MIYCSKFQICISFSKFYIGVEFKFKNNKSKKFFTFSKMCNDSATEALLYFVHKQKQTQKTINNIQTERGKKNETKH